MHTALVARATDCPTASQQQVQDGLTVGHAKPYSSFNSWSNLLISGHNTLHGHTHRLTLDFLICALMSKWQPFKVANRQNFPIFPSGIESMGDRGSKKAYTCARTGMYLHTKFGCDRSIDVGYRSWNDWHPDKQNGMTMRFTLCETWRNRCEWVNVSSVASSPRSSLTKGC